jgi:hypothetical protein
MDVFAELIGTIALAGAAGALGRGLKAVRGTTLLVGWAWAIAALFAWTAVWILDVLAGSVGSGTADQLWYFVAVLGLCPLVSILGARRPISRAWPWFVLCPLVLVLSWPALLDWQATSRGRPLELEEPAILGFFLVLLMGAGNYLGTRHGATAVLAAAALALLVAPLTVGFPQERLSRESARELATICLGAAGAFALLIRTGGRFADRFERLWYDFRNDYGIVWAKRIQDRVNMEAEKEGWSVRLTPHGFDSEHVPEPRLSPAETEARVEHTLRWLLRRFVNDEWIETRLPSR